MKTIKEKSAEYARKIWAGGKRPSAKKMTEQDFTAGAEWMREELTRWIPVEEQKPEIGKLVLAKVSDEDGTTYGVVEYVGPSVWGLPFGFVPDDALPTHWREIF